MHRFDPETEPATVLLEANPRRYFTVARVSKEGKVRVRPDGKDDTAMIYLQGSKPGPESRMWVPPRVADDLTAQQPSGREGSVPMIARIVGRRTVEEAKAGVVPEAPKAPARRKPAAG